MPGNYTHESVSDGTVLTAAIYNDRHQNHINFRTPSGLDDYSASLTLMQQMTDPGTVGAEALATDLSGELARLRFAIRRLLGLTHWYESPRLNTVSSSGNQTLDSSDFGYIPKIKLITGAAELTLPAASDTSAAKRLIVKNTGDFVVKILRAGTDTVDGLTQYRIPPYGMASLISNGTDAFYLLENPYRQPGMAVLPSGAAISWAYRLYPKAGVTLAHNATLVPDTILDTGDGVASSLLVTQDGTGGRTMDYDAAYHWPLDTAPVLSTAAGAVDLLSFITIGGVHYGVAAYNLA